MNFEKGIERNWQGGGEQILFTLKGEGKGIYRLTPGRWRKDWHRRLISK